MSDDRLGSIPLQGSSELVFSIGAWKGQPRASVRKFVTTSSYTGPTQSGLSLRGDVLVGVMEALERVQTQVATKSFGEHARVSKSGQAEIVVSTVAADSRDALPSVDVREYVQTAGYTGPTKSGVRFSWDKLADVIALMRLQAQRLGANETRQPTLFPEARPVWVDDTDKPTPRDPVLADLLPNGPKHFPDDFLDGVDASGTVVDLPGDSLSVVQKRDGRYVVHSQFGFSHDVRNPTEGSFLLYGQLRGLRVIKVPREMIVVFRAVKGYENYVRELQRSLLLAYERHCGNRAVAEHQAKRALKDHGLPWLERS